MDCNTPPVGGGVARTETRRCLCLTIVPGLSVPGCPGAESPGTSIGVRSCGSGSATLLDGAYMIRMLPLIWGHNCLPIRVSAMNQERPARR